MNDHAVSNGSSKPQQRQAPKVPRLEDTVHADAHRALEVATIACLFFAPELSLGFGLANAVLYATEGHKREALVEGGLAVLPVAGVAVKTGISLLRPVAEAARNAGGFAKMVEAGVKVAREGRAAAAEARAAAKTAASSTGRAAVAEAKAAKTTAKTAEHMAEQSERVVPFRKSGPRSSPSGKVRTPKASGTGDKVVELQPKARPGQASSAHQPEPPHAPAAPRNRWGDGDVGKYKRLVQRPVGEWRTTATGFLPQTFGEVIQAGSKPFIRAGIRQVVDRVWEPTDEEARAVYKTLHPHEIYSQDVSRYLLDDQRAPEDSGVWTPSGMDRLVKSAGDFIDHTDHRAEEAVNAYEKSHKETDRRAQEALKAWRRSRGTAPSEAAAVAGESSGAAKPVQAPPNLPTTTGATVRSSAALAPAQPSARPTTQQIVNGAMAAYRKKVEEGMSAYRQQAGQSSPARP
jgi:hypothetical protein